MTKILTGSTAEVYIDGVLINVAPTSSNTFTILGGFSCSCRGRHFKIWQDDSNPNQKLFMFLHTILDHR